MKKITQAEYAQAVSQGVVVIDFFAEWCPPCKALAPYLEQIQMQYGDALTIYKVDVDEEQILSQQQGIVAMPTLLFYKDGERVNMVKGADLPRIMAIIDALVK